MTVDRVTLRRDDEAWLQAAWEDEGSLVLVVDDGQAAVDETAAGTRLALVPAARAPQGDRYLLGVQDGRVFWATPGPLAGRGGGLRELSPLLGERDTDLLLHAVALSNWHRTHTHCPRCGAPTLVARGGAVRVCDADGSEHFPRVDPAVIMLVHDGGDRCVLGRQERWPPRRFSVLAGFVEPGERAEQAVVREVAEEVGLAVTDVRYTDSQPWPFPSSLMLGFTARVVDAQAKLVLDPREIAEAAWYSRGTVRAALCGEVDDPLLPPPFTIAHRLMARWVQGEDGVAP